MITERNPHVHIILYSEKKILASDEDRAQLSLDNQLLIKRMIVEYITRISSTPVKGFDKNTQFSLFSYRKSKDI